MTPSIDQKLHLFANLLPNWTLIPILTLLPNFGGFHRTLQRVRLANRGRLLLRTPGPVPFGTCICSNVETILSWTCHVYGPFEFRTSLGTSILLIQQYEITSPECSAIFHSLIIQSVSLSISHCINLWHWYVIWPLFTELMRNIWDECRMPNKWPLLTKTPDSLLRLVFLFTFVMIFQTLKLKRPLMLLFYFFID